MANTKISQLPSWTGTAADLRWFVMNNSGQTETFKFSGYTSQLIPGTGTDSFQTIGSTASTANSIVIGKNSYVANGDNQIFIGNNIQSSSTGTREKNVIIGSILGATKPENSNAIVGYDNTPGGGYNNNILGINNVGNGHSSVVGSNNTAGFIGTTIGLGNTAGQQSVAIGQSNTAGGGISIAIGQGNTDNSNNRIIAIGGSNNIGSAWSVGLGYGNTLVGSNFSTESVLIGYGNTITAGGLNTGNINIGQSQTISDGSYNTILNGKTNTLSSTGFYNTILNGLSNTISSATFTSSIIGGKDNVLNIATGSTIFAGNSCSIIGDSTYSGILGGTDNDITATNKSAIIGGSQNYMSGGTESGIFTGFQNTNNGSRSVVIGGQANSINNPLAERAAIISSYNSSITGNTDQSFVVGGNNNSIGAGESFILGGNYSQITGGGNNEIIGSRESTITGGNDVSLINTLNSNSGSYDRVVMLGTSGRTSTTSSATFVENLVVFNYAALDFANDTAAAAGGVVLGQVYHHNGDLRIRIV
jgi:hypothetical protein